MTLNIIFQRYTELLVLSDWRIPFLYKAAGDLAPFFLSQNLEKREKPANSTIELFEPITKV